MINYLKEYGISAASSVFDEIDITDKTQLESQINRSRENYFNLIHLLDSIDEQMLKSQRDLNKLSKKILKKAKETNIRPNDLFNTDDHYLELEYKIDALKTGKEMVKEQISYCQTDLRIFQSTFYSKF